MTAIAAPSISGGRDAIPTAVVIPLADQADQPGADAAQALGSLVGDANETACQATLAVRLLAKGFTSLAYDGTAS
jgi:hypothetical protein